MNFEANKSSLFQRAGLLIILVVLTLFFIMPEGRMGGVIGSGHTGANDGKTALFCRSYHRAPWELKSYLPAFYRAEEQSADIEKIYTSHLPYLYWCYTAVTKVTGLSLATVRLTALSFTLLSVIAVCLLRVGKNSGADKTGLIAATLFATCPLTLIYGDMAELYIPIALGFFLSCWSVGRFVSGRFGWLGLFLCSIPLAFSSTVLTPFLALAGMFAVWWRWRDWKKAVKVGIVLGLMWFVVMLVHMGMVYHAFGSLDRAIGRGSARGFMAAFRSDDNPFMLVQRSFTERLGLPILIFSLAGLYSSWKARKEDAEQFAFNLTVWSGTLIFVVFFLQLFAEHRYGLQMFATALSVSAAPVMAGLLKSDGKKKWVAVLVLVACGAIMVHRGLRWEKPKDEERDLATLSTHAGKLLQGRDLLFISNNLRMAALMSAGWYSDCPLMPRRPEYLNEIDSKEYPVIIMKQPGTVVSPWLSGPVGSHYENRTGPDTTTPNLQLLAVPSFQD